MDHELMFAARVRAFEARIDQCGDQTAATDGAEGRQSTDLADTQFQTCHRWQGQVT
jgi:hypothetical protein